MDRKKSLIGLLGVIVLSALGTAENFEFLPFGIFIVSIVGAVISLMFALFTRRYRTARLFGLLIAISLLAATFDVIIADRQRENTEQTASQVIAAIERYRAAHGALPESLNQLVPGQLAELPTARNGRPFWFEGSLKNFSLSFSMPFLLVRSYDSKTKKWSTHD